MEMKRGEIYVIQTRQNEFVFAFDRFEHNIEWDRLVYFDYFCVDVSRGMKVVCNELPLAIDPVSIRIATEDERDIFFRRIRAELLECKMADIVKNENDNAGQLEGSD